MKLELVRNTPVQTLPGGVDDYGRPVLPRSFFSPEDTARGREFWARYVSARKHCTLERAHAAVGLDTQQLLCIRDGWHWFATPEMHAEALRRIEALGEGEVKKQSKVVEFVNLAHDACKDMASNSYTDRIHAVSDAIGFAIEHGFWWHKDDYATLVKEYDGMRSCTGVVFPAGFDYRHVKAVKAGNVSAANSIDAFYRQAAMYGLDKDGNRIRLTIGSDVVLDGERWTVTSMPYSADKEDKPVKNKIGVCQYDKPASEYGRHITRRRVVGQSELTPVEVQP